MPSNVIHVNRSDDLAWEVPDSKMPRLLKLLQEIGSKRPEPPKKPRDLGRGCPV